MGWREIALATPFKPDKVSKLSREELEVAYEELSKIAPFGVYGDGIDTFLDDLDPWDAKTDWDYRVSEIFSIVRNELRLLGVGDICQDKVVEFARQHFEVMGISGDALDNYFYPDIDGDFFDGWAWLDADIARAIEDRRWRILDSLDEEKIISWITRYPWRKCQSLRILVRFGHIRKHTIDWHAANILFHSEKIEAMYFRKDEISDCDEEVTNLIIKEQIRYGLEMGASYKAIILKQGHEDNAIRGKKVVDSARAGGAARGSRMRGRGDEILIEMKYFIDNGHSITNAARLTHAKGIGATAEANRKAWTRRKNR